MSISLTLPSGDRKSSTGDTILIGSAPSCQVCISDPRIRSKHAIIRKVAGKWIIEAEGDWTLKVNDGVGARKCWLNEGCEVHLTEEGPTVLFSTVVSSELAKSPRPEQPSTRHQTLETSSGINHQLSIWHYSKGNQKFGPVSFQQLSQITASGELKPTDMVWKEGMAEWQPAQVVKGLFPEPSKATPPIPKSSAIPPPLPSTNRQDAPASTTQGSSKRFWMDWDLGSRLIFAASCLSVLAIVGRPTIFWWLILFAYPMIAVWNRRPIHYGGMICAGLGLLVTTLTMMIWGVTGALSLFGASTALLGVGVLVNRKTMVGMDMYDMIAYSWVCSLLLLGFLGALATSGRGNPQIAKGYSNTLENLTSSGRPAEPTSTDRELSPYDIIVAFKDRPETLRGYEIALKASWASHASKSMRRSLADTIGEDSYTAEFRISEISDTSSTITLLATIITLEIDNDLDVPNLSFGEDCIIKFDCTKGDPQKGNKAISIRRP